MELVSYTRESLSLSLSFSFSTCRTINESGPRCVVELAALQRTAVCTPDICACFIEHPFFSTIKRWRLNGLAVSTALSIYIYTYHNSLADSRKSLLFFPSCLLKICTTKKESAKWLEFSWSIKIRLIPALSISIAMVEECSNSVRRVASALNYECSYCGDPSFHSPSRRC